MDAVSLAAPSLWEFAERRQVVGLVAWRVAAGKVSAADLAGGASSFNFSPRFRQITFSLIF
jgi:hypothetical protein